MKRLELHLDFVTPLWTADATGEAHHVEGTGLVGSLRWWYEALIRGLGGWACDPTDDSHRCPQDGPVTAENLDDTLCAACQFFGATGWGKLFRLGIGERTRREYPPTAVEDTTRTVTSSRSIRVKSSGGGRGYFYPPGLADSVSLTFHPRRAGDEDTLVILLGLLEFIRRNAALGAKTNLGYGLFKWERKPQNLDLIVSAFAQLMAGQAKRGRSARSETWPSLLEMFFADVNVAYWRPKRFADFKYNLRAAFRDGASVRSLVQDTETREALRHFLLGTIEESPSQASKIKMALLPDRRTLRLWGWVPHELPGGVDRDDVIDLIHSGFPERHILRWREFDSTHDTVGRFTDGTAYLDSLMEEQR